MKKTTLLVFLAFSAVLSYGQDKLFGPSATAPKIKSGFILNGNGSFDIPAGDMAKRFGVSYRLGPAVTYKTLSNWLFGVKFDFILGNLIKEDSLMCNIRDKYSGSFNGKLVEVINLDGNRIGVPVYERGYAVGVSVGRIIPLNKGQHDNGLMLLSTLGFVQHKINIYNRDKDVPSLLGDYLKGYDRLTNGLFVEQFIGYNYFAKNKLLNFNFGLDILWGFTQGRRDYLYDVMRTDKAQRNDILFGVRGGWMIPIFKHKSEDISFE